MKDPAINCTVVASPDDVDAGAEFTLKVSVQCAGDGGLGEAFASIRDAHGAEVAKAKLAPDENGRCETSDIVLIAPCSVGEHVYRAEVLAGDGSRASPALANGETRLIVKAHTAQLNVWAMPSAIVAGNRFKLLVGARCSAGCNLGGQSVHILDHEGSEAGRVQLGVDTWPGTDALYFAEAELAAPPAVGLHQWQVRTAGWALDLPHAPGWLDTSVTTVAPADCEITITVIDSDSQTPISGARVVMHPYRATTDEHGIAKINVSKGRYDVLISASRYVTYLKTLETEVDLTTVAELDVDTSWGSPDEVLE